MARTLIDCPKCKKPTPTKAGKCAKCGTEKPNAPISKRSGGKKIDPFSVIKKVKEAGGLASIKKSIKATEDAESGLSSFGGLLGAKQAVAMMETLESALKS